METGIYFYYHMSERSERDGKVSGILNEEVIQEIITKGSDLLAFSHSLSVFR